MKKKKILLVNDAHFMSTGYGVYGKNILERFYNSGKYEVAELALWSQKDHPNSRPTGKWKIYNNQPDPGNEQQKKHFDSNPQNRFGRWKFESVCLDFKPDVVLSILDPWMFDYHYYSPFKRIFKHVVMPTVDTECQQAGWLSYYSLSDAVLTYQDWSGEVLKKECNKINWVGSAPPAASNEFYPLQNRKDIRKIIGLEDDVKIIGTVMRNQRRKLYPELFRAFRKFIDTTKHDKTILWCHTGFPESGVDWNIPELINQYNMSSYAYFTYMCDKCGLCCATPFTGILQRCRNCGNFSCRMPRPEFSIPESSLRTIYNAFDVYVQFATCLTPGQDVLTSEGWKPIEDVQIGDLAYTHNGKYKYVTKLFRNDHDGNIRKISVWGDSEELELTNEHPVYAIKKDGDYSRSLREDIGRKIKDGIKIPDVEFIDAGKLEKGDLIAFKINENEQDLKEIDLSEFCNDKYIIDNKSYRHKNSKVEHKRFLNVDEDFCKWLGLFVADGHVNKSGEIQITSHIKEKENQSLCELVMSNFGNFRFRGYKGRNGTDCVISNKILAKYIKDNCYNEKQKKLPDWTMTLPIEKQKRIIQGLFMGDGHFISENNTSVYCTVSYDLSVQIKELCRRIGLTYNQRVVKKKGNRQDQYRFEIRADIANGIFDTSRSSTKSLIHDGYYFYQIKSIEDFEYSGLVYNFEVEDDNSYCSKIGNVHNCEGFGMPQVEAGMCGTPVMSNDYSAMSDIVRKIDGTPIDIKLKYKEIETGRYITYPDEDSLVKNLETFFNQPSFLMEPQRQKVAKLTKDNYSWENTANKWMEVIDGLDYADWSVEHKFLPAIESNDKIMQAEPKVFTEWLLSHAPNLPPYMQNRISKSINYQFSFERKTPYSREDAIKELMGHIVYYNTWEEKR